MFFIQGTDSFKYLSLHLKCFFRSLTYSFLIFLVYTESEQSQYEFLVLKFWLTGSQIWLIVDPVCLAVSKALLAQFKAWLHT